MNTEHTHTHSMTKAKQRQDQEQEHENEGKHNPSFSTSCFGLKVSKTTIFTFYRKKMRKKCLTCFVYFY